MLRFFILFLWVFIIVSCSDEPVRPNVTITTPTPQPTPQVTPPPPTQTDACSQTTTPSDLSHFYTITLSALGDHSEGANYKVIELKTSNGCTRQLARSGDCAKVHKNHFSTLVIQSRRGSPVRVMSICRPGSSRYYSNVCRHRNGHARGYDEGHYLIDDFEGNVQVDESPSDACAIILN